MSDSWWGCYTFLETEQRGSVGPSLLAFFLKALFLVMKDEVKQNSFISEWFTSHLRVKCVYRTDPSSVTSTKNNAMTKVLFENDHGPFNIACLDIF